MENGGLGGKGSKNEELVHEGLDRVGVEVWGSQEALWLLLGFQNSGGGPWIEKKEPDEEEGGGLGVGGGGGEGHLQQGTQEARAFFF